MGQPLPRQLIPEEIEDYYTCDTCRYMREDPRPAYQTRKCQKHSQEEYRNMPPRQSSRRSSGGRSESRGEQKPIKTVAGRVGGDPEWRQAGDADVIEFSVAVTQGYGDDAPPPLWIQCTAWDRKPEMQDFIENEIFKGSAVAVEGTYSTNQGGDGKTYHKINVVRVGLIDWFKAPEQARSGRRQEAEAAPAGRRSRQEPQDDAVDTDDLPF